VSAHQTGFFPQFFSFLFAALPFLFLVVEVCFQVDDFKKLGELCEEDGRGCPSSGQNLCTHSISNAHAHDKQAAPRVE
jgi:hypothetical protein